MSRLSHSAFWNALFTVLATASWKISIAGWFVLGLSSMSMTSCSDHMLSCFHCSVCSGLMDDLEYQCYTEWFDFLMKDSRPQLDLIGELSLVASSFDLSLYAACHCYQVFIWFLVSLAIIAVYLRTSPEVAHQRLCSRARKEESTVPKEYIYSLHRQYERWLGTSANHSWHGNTPVLVSYIPVRFSMLLFVGRCCLGLSFFPFCLCAR